MDGSWIGGRICLFGVLICWFAGRYCLRDTVLDGYAIFVIG